MEWTLSLFQGLSRVLDYARCYDAQYGFLALHRQHLVGRGEKSVIDLLATAKSVWICSGFWNMNRLSEGSGEDYSVEVIPQFLLTKFAWAKRHPQPAHNLEVLQSNTLNESSEQVLWMTMLLLPKQK